MKAPQKGSKMQSRPTTKNITKMSESESSSSIDDEETRATPGAELAKQDSKRDNAKEIGEKRSSLQFAYNTHP